MACQICGGECIETSKALDVKSELGFITKVQIYRCKDCGTDHVLCPDCDGKGFIDPEDDCSLCQGMGVLTVKQVKEINE